MDQNNDSTNPVVPDPVTPVSDAPSLDTSTVPASPADSTDGDSKTDALESTTDSNPTVAPDLTTPENPDTPVEDTETPEEVAKKISESQNVLIALSSDPSVDEMAAAIGLSIYLDKLGKRATAIYSGATPNALEFLNPEENFEPTVDTLQDFVIALDKDKADHLRYKLDGDYVKIFITPYKTRLSEDDLDYSYGDFNVDLVLALNVINGTDLDSALREHGRIMHDAVIINVTTGNPGKFGEIEWSNKSASSISEMLAKLIYDANGKVKIGKEEATAFLTGIVAATDRFSNAKTSSTTMDISSKLMESGANQQLVSKNITSEVDNNNFHSTLSNEKKENDDPTKLDIAHGVEEQEEEEAVDTDTSATEQDSTLLNDLKAAEATLAQTGDKTVPDESNKPVDLNNVADVPTIEDLKSDLLAANQELSEDLPETTTSETAIPEAVTPVVAEPVASVEPAAPAESVAPMEPVAAVDFSQSPVQSESQEGFNKPEKVLQPSVGLTTDSLGESTEKYGKMLEDALSGLGGETTPSEPTPIVGMNPASDMAPSVPTNPEINGVPEINYMPMPGEEVLPPPPTPPIDMNMPTVETYTAPEEAATPVEPTPVAQQPVEPVAPVVTPEIDTAMVAQTPIETTAASVPPTTDPGAFKIPGM